MVEEKNTKDIPIDILIPEEYNVLLHAQAHIEEFLELKYYDNKTLAYTTILEIASNIGCWGLTAFLMSNTRAKDDIRIRGIRYTFTTVYNITKTKVGKERLMHDYITSFKPFSDYICKIIAEGYEFIAYPEMIIRYPDEYFKEFFILGNQNIYVDISISNKIEKLITSFSPPKNEEEVRRSSIVMSLVTSELGVVIPEFESWLNILTVKGGDASYDNPESIYDQMIKKQPK